MASQARTERRTAARRATQPEPTPSGCRCPSGRPTPYATWRDGDLVQVDRLHHPGCGLPVVPVDPTVYGARHG